MYKTSRYDIIDNRTNQVVFSNLSWDDAQEEMADYYFRAMKENFYDEVKNNYRIQKNKELSRVSYEKAIENRKKKRRAKSFENVHKPQISNTVEKDHRG